jgi:hypothetical protein
MKTAGTVVVVALACVATVASSPPVPCEENGVFRGTIWESPRVEGQNDFYAEPSDGSYGVSFLREDARPVFAKCAEVDAIVGTVSISSDMFPALKKVGFLSTSRSFDASIRLDELSGFDDVEEVGDVWNFENITGLNNVKESGSLRSVKIDGMRSLERAGSIDASETAGLGNVKYAHSVRRERAPIGAFFLPNLEELTGNFVVVTDFSDVFEMNSIQTIAGSVVVSGNGFTDWRGFARGAAIGGDFIVYQNGGLASSQVQEWVGNESVQVKGNIIICKNDNEDQDSCPRNFVYEEPE